MTKTQFKTLDRKSVEARAADVLQDAIVLGKIAAGTRLTELHLATDLGASRGTIRAALSKVAAAGLIVQRPYSRWEVIRFSPHDVWELFTLRAALEGMAARIMIDRQLTHGRYQVAQMLDRLQIACRDGSSAAIASADLDFHKSIILGAEHALLADHFQRVEIRIRMLIASANAMLSSPSEILRQ